MAGTGMGFDDKPPEIYTGGYFDQTQVVNQAEGLQDFRRRQEGHLIIADDRPLLVMAFGAKYSGPNPAKYRIEGKYDIPVGYKVIIKWDEDEIVFMTAGHIHPRVPDSLSSKKPSAGGLYTLRVESVHW
jgi:hypothetical protein